MVDVQFDMSIEEVRSLYQAVCDALKYWPGGDPEQQEDYQHLKTFLFRVLCEVSLDQ